MRILAWKPEYGGLGNEDLKRTSIPSRTLRTGEKKRKVANKN